MSVYVVYDRQPIRIVSILWPGAINHQASVKAAGAQHSQYAAHMQVEKPKMLWCPLFGQLCIFQASRQIDAKQYILFLPHSAFLLFFGVCRCQAWSKKWRAVLATSCSTMRQSSAWCWAKASPTLTSKAVLYIYSYIFIYLCLYLYTYIHTHCL